MQNQPTIYQILKCMSEYQRKNNITKQCITNCMYVYDCIHSSGMTVKAQAVIAILNDKYARGICSGHIVLVSPNGKIIDPSHEITSHDNVIYFNTITELKKEVDIPPELCKEIIKDVINFTAIAEQMNSGKCVIANETHYNKQADYVEEHLQRTKQKSSYR